MGCVCRFVCDGLRSRETTISSFPLRGRCPRRFAGDGWGETPNRPGTSHNNGSLSPPPRPRCARPPRPPGRGRRLSRVPRSRLPCEGSHLSRNRTPGGGSTGVAGEGAGTATRSLGTRQLSELLPWPQVVAVAKQLSSIPKGAPLRPCGPPKEPGGGTDGSRGMPTQPSAFPMP